MLQLILGLSFFNVILHPQKLGITYIKIILAASITHSHISNPNHFFSAHRFPTRTILLKYRSYRTSLQLYLPFNGPGKVLFHLQMLPFMKVEYINAE